MHFYAIFFLILLSSMCCREAISTQLTASPAPARCPLADLPSTPNVHIAKIQALADNTWINLGAPTADPKWGRARGRSWGGRALVLAPELRGAFYYGEGVHGFVKPDGHMMDDLWFYDINGHRWIAIYPGTDTGSFSQRITRGELKVDADGQLTDSNAHPVPVHLLIHAWNYLTYDLSSRKFAFIAGRGFGRYYIGEEAKLDAGLKSLEAQLRDKPTPALSPWFYNTVAGVFERYPVNKPPPDIGGFANFQYIKSRNQYFYGGSSGVAYYNDQTREWLSVNDKGPRPVGYDHGGAYDEKRDRIYMGAGAHDPTGSFYMYDLKLETWRKPNQQGAPPSGFRTNDASIFYDTQNDVVTVFQYLEKKIYTYSPASDRWSSREFPSDILSSISYASFSAFYDPALNVAFLFGASDSADNGIMWAYRYKR